MSALLLKVYNSEIAVEAIKFQISTEHNLFAKQAEIGYPTLCTC